MADRAMATDDVHQDSSARADFPTPSGSGTPSAIERLNGITRRLQTLGRVCALSTALNVLFVILVFIQLPVVSPVRLAIQLIPLAYSLLALTVYDSLRKRGEAIFEELSEEVQWRVIHSENSASLLSSTSESEHTELPRIDIRISLREFARTTSLPLVSSSTPGTTTYTIANLLLFGTQIALLVATHQIYLVSF
jgi:hypothetical protein